MKKKNGFIFAETIIVLSILAGGLVLLYSTFANIIRKEKVKATYNQTIDIYNLQMMKEYLQQIKSEFPNDTILPRGNPTVNSNQINTGQNSYYFRLECMCNQVLNQATYNKYGYYYCSDTIDPLYSNYCSDLSNHLNVRDIYIIPNDANKIKLAVQSIITHGKRISDCGISLKDGGPCPVDVAGKTFNVPKYDTSNIVGIPRTVNATLIDYLKTLSPIISTIPGEVWSNDYIIIGEFFREGHYYYTSLRFEG